MDHNNINQSNQSNQTNFFSNNSDDVARHPLPSLPNRPPQGLPARTRSDSREYAAGGLIEDWPNRTANPAQRRRPVHSVDSIDDTAFGAFHSPNAPAAWTARTYNPRLKKQVKFSPSSSLHLYRKDVHYPKNCYYSKQDRRNLTRETLREARRIKALAARVPGLSGGEAIRYLIQHKVIDQEQVVGIEHLLIDQVTMEILREREHHAAACLTEFVRQKGQRRMGRAMDPERLARVANLSSRRSVRRARVRAALAS